MLKRKLNWLDITLIAAVILAVAAAAWYFTRGEELIASNQKEYTVTLRFTRETAHPTDYYEIGGFLYHTDEILIGEILRLEEKELVTEEFNPQAGEYQLITDPEKKQIEMQVKVAGEIKNGLLMVNGKELYVGMKFYPQGANTRSTMEIWDIKDYAEPVKYGEEAAE